MSNTTQRILLGAGVYAAGTYAAYTYIAKTKAPMPQADDGVCGGCTCAFDRIANVYDERISMEETMLGYGLLRRWMMRHAKGDVLEVAAGTGRNLPYYRYGDISSLTLADISPPMLEVAQAKYFDELAINFRHTGHKARFCVADAQRLVAEQQQGGDAAEGSTGSGEQGPAQRRSWWALGSISRSSSKSSSSSSNDSSSSTQQQASAPPSEAWAPATRVPATGAPAPAAPPAAPSTPLPAPPPAAQQQELEQSPFARLFKSSTEQQQQQQQPAQPPASQQGTSTSSTAAAAAVPSPSPAAPHAPSSQQQQQQQPHSHPAAPTPGTGSNTSASASSALTTFQPASFDVVVETFGLCSHDDPVAALQQMAAVVRPGGRVVLLEHGASSWEWLQRKLEDGADAHYRKWGCRWDRDILGIVQQAGLRLESVSRWHLGTTYLIVASSAAQGA